MASWIALTPMMLQATQLQHRGNPIGQAVNMLQIMQHKVKEEGGAEAALFDTFICYCSKAGGELGIGLKSGKEKIELLSAPIKSSKGKKAQAESDLKMHQASRAVAKHVMAQATALREKEAAAFAAYDEEAKTSIAALSKATPAIENGMSTSFLQTSEASMLRTFTMEKADLPEESRQELLVFLSGKRAEQDDEDFEHQSGQILGILKQMHDEMQKDLDGSSATEADGVKKYEELISAAHHRHLPHRPEIDLRALALTGKKIGLENIMAMIDTMVADLKREQMDDDAKKVYCPDQLDIYEDKKKETDHALKDSETAMEEMEGSIVSLTEEIATLTQGFKDLDAKVAEATRQRKAENAEYKDLRWLDPARYFSWVAWIPSLILIMAGVEPIESKAANLAQSKAAKMPGSYVFASSSLPAFWWRSVRCSNTSSTMVCASISHFKQATL